MSKIKLILAYFLPFLCIFSFLTLQNDYANHVHDEASLKEAEYIPFTKIAASYFEQKITSQETFFVMVGSEECSGCLEYSPILKEAAGNLEVMDRVFYIDIDSEDNKEIMLTDYGIAVLPTTLIIVNGEIVNRVEGVQLENEVEILLRGIITE